MTANALRNFNILIVDGDIKLGNIVKGMLEHMGFPNVQATANGQQALDVLRQTPIDFMITEWNTREIDGLELLNRIRRDRTTPEQTLPIIMLTGRAEKEDVITARDYGINEYVIKPFTSQTLYSRLERLIEMPRQFVLSQYFVGPDRRSSGAPPKGQPERRQPPLKAIPKPAGAAAATDNAVWLPDYKLKLKLGKETSLSSVITPALIADAQKTVETSSPESINWLQENLAHLKQLKKKMIEGDLYTLLPIDLGETALTMSSRSGTFGYSSASKIAYLLYLFCRNHLKVEDPAHQLVAEKHISALQVTLANPQRGMATRQEREIISELQNLVDRFAA